MNTTNGVRLIFLDIDGVLNSAQYLREHPGAFDGRKLSQMLDPVAVARLTRLAEQSGADFVISSSWRIPFRMADIREALGTHGFNGRIVGKTPIAGKLRGDQIQGYLDNTALHRPVGRFVILDDDSDMGHLAPVHVKTTYEFGLQDEHCVLALKILGVSA